MHDSHACHKALHLIKVAVALGLLQYGVWHDVVGVVADARLGLARSFSFWWPSTQSPTRPPTCICYQYASKGSSCVRAHALGPVVGAVVGERHES